MLSQSVAVKFDPNGDLAQSSPTDSLLNYLVLRYFAHYFAVCIIKARKDDSLSHFAAPIPTIVIETDHRFEQLFLLAVDAGCQAFIVTEQTAKPFFDAFLPVHDAASQRSVQKRLIVVLSPNSSVFATIHETLVIEEIPDTLLILPIVQSDQKLERIELYTVDIYDGDPIAIVPRLIDVLEEAKEWFMKTRDDPSNDHFPDKFADMHRRRLRLGTVPYLPNAHVADVPLGKGNARYILPTKPNVSAQVDGTELWLVVLFCEITNCTTEVMMASEWGTVFENGTKIGLIGAPAKRQVDIILGGLYSWYSSFGFLAFTAVHSRSGCTCIVPKPHLVTNWRTPFLSFTGSLWCAVSLAFLSGAIAILVVSRSRQRILQLAGAAAPVTFSDSVLLMIGFFMEQTVPMPHELLASCVLFTTLMFAGFMIGSSYNGGLASTMIVPQYEHCINTAHELAETRMTWVGVTVSWIYSILLADQPDLLTLKQTFREWDDDTIERHGPDRDLAIIVERMEYGHYAFPSVSIDTIKCRQILTDDIYWEWVVGMSTKTWPARARFDRMVHELKAFGILAHWELIGAVQFLGLESQQIIHYSRDIPSDDSKPLRISNISGALLILVGGLVISAVVFFVELLWHRLSQSIKQDFLHCTVRCFITKLGLLAVKPSK
ncbi:uncharacterized protein LOC128270067 [Anopheles cruzii]|uniref:uncharacterized protein LOC128270067 n=1 Tax=Anopheles cruzii TaxID=68878 RepID=UPI0022EC5F61|nr:uncharacterized protein LOC128270067 [Anopheles cruzii]